MKRNLLLITFLIFLSILLANPIGNIILSKLLGSSGNFGTFSIPSSVGDFLNGFPFIYILLSPLLFVAFGKGKKWIWTGISVLPIAYLLFYIESGKQIWIWAVMFFIAGVIIGYGLKLLILKINTKGGGVVVS